MNSYNLTGLYEGMEKITFEKPVGENNIQVSGSCPIQGLRPIISVLFCLRSLSHEAFL